MSWNDERVEALKKLWADGLSASQIAGRLGGVTRNAVIGKVHRLGLAGRATTSRMKSHRPRVRSQAARRLMKARPQVAAGNQAFRNLYLGDSEPYVPPAEEIVIPMHERKYIQTLTETCCRWPIGDPQQPDFHFCGKSKIRACPTARSMRAAPSSRRKHAAATATWCRCRRCPGRSSPCRCRSSPTHRTRRLRSDLPVPDRKGGTGHLRGMAGSNSGVVASGLFRPHLRRH